jgi:hypothetical protein
MRNQLSCPNGQHECDFEERHELALAGKILRMIEGYTKDHSTYPCPKCLRNSIMAIAALLHLEASKAAEQPCEEKRPGEAGFVDSFAEAARERILSVMDAVEDLDTMLGKRTLM